MIISGVETAHGRPYNTTMNFGEFVKQAQALLASKPELANLPVAIEQDGYKAAREVDGMQHRFAGYDPVREIGHASDDRTSPEYILISGYGLE